jgi:hypothetical protein
MELAREVMPAPALHTGDGDDDLGVASDQDGDVEDAVLLGAHQFLTVQEQDALVGQVVEAQLGHGAALGELGDAGQVPLQRLVQGQVVLGSRLQPPPGAAG